MVVLNAVQGVLSIIIMIGIGYVLSKKGWFDDRSSKLLSKIVVNVSLPLYMVSNMTGTYTKDKLVELAGGLIVPFLSMTTCYGIGRLVAKLVKIPPNRRGTFCSIFALSNTVFVGLPVNLALFGEESVPYALIYFIGNTVLFWTIGVYGISTDGDNKGNKLLSLNNLKRIFSPPLVGFLVGVALVLLEIKLPRSILDVCRYMGNLTTPLSMLFIGIVIYSVDLKSIRFDKGVVALLLGRFVIAPFLVIVICRGLPIPLLMKKVFVVQAAMPAMTQTSIIAENYKADYEYAAVMTTITTLFSLISIPFYMILLSSTGIF